MNPYQLERVRKILTELEDLARDVRCSDVEDSEDYNQGWNSACLYNAVQMLRSALD